MSDAFLRIRFDDDGDGPEDLSAYASSGYFSGTASECFNISEIETFAYALTGYPISNDARPRIAGGYFTKSGSTCELTEEHLGITVYPINSRGYLGIQVRMATSDVEGTRPEARESATVELITTYEPLARFGRQSFALLKGTTEDAILICGQ